MTIDKIISAYTDMNMHYCFIVLFVILTFTLFSGKGR